MSCSGPPSRSDSIRSSLQPSLRATASASSVTRDEWPRVYGSRASIAPVSIFSMYTRALTSMRCRGSLLPDPIDGPDARRAAQAREIEAVLDRPQQAVVRHRRTEVRPGPDERAQRERGHAVAAIVGLVEGDEHDRSG